MIVRELIVLFVVLVVLLALCGVVLIAILQDYDRRQKLEARMQDVVTPADRHPNPVEEELSLTHKVSKTQELKERAAGFIGVDLRQAETYPIKWWLVLTKFVFNWFTNRRNAKLLEQFPDSLSTIVRCVRVGIPMGEALRMVARDAQEPTKAEFEILADKVSIGIPLDIALRELSQRIKLTEYQFFATAITLQARSGGGITQTLETLAEVIRKRVGLKARGYALTAEARTSAMILSVLPFVAGGAIFVMQRPYIVLLFTTKSGESILGLAILLMGMGMGIIQYMISNVLK